MKKLFKAMALATAIATAPMAQANPLSMSAMDVVKDMGLGINLGNTFESWPWEGANWTTVDNIETGWGSPKITKAMIDSYKSSGFKTIRIPVAWSNLMTGGSDYIISAELLDRVEEVVDWVLEEDMYAIVNIHWDGGWWENFPTDSAECMNRYKKMWAQIAAKFKDKSGYLIFESLNEEGVWQDIWNRYGGGTEEQKKIAYNMLNAINQEFTDLVRASGGNNASRHLLIAGYATDINLTCDALFKMPEDPQDNQSVSVHYYDPFGFTHLNKNEDWAAMRNTWGTPADISELNNYMDKLKTAFVDKEVPVIVGEYGFAAELNETRNAEQVRNYTVAVAKAIYERGMLPILWDTQNDNQQYYNNRKSNPPGFYDSQLIDALKAIAQSSDPSSSSQPSSSSDGNSSSSDGGGSSSSGSGNAPIMLPASAGGQIYALAINGRIVLGNLPANAKAEIYNLRGERAHSANAKGMYIVRVSHGGETKVFRVPVM